MQLFLVKGQMYQNGIKSENFNIYYAKQYYKGALDIWEKFKLDKEKDRVERNQQKGYENLKNKCLAVLNNLNSMYIIESQNTLSTNKLISNDLLKDREKLYLLLDAFHQIIAKSEGIDDTESYKNIAFSYANIIKIEYKLLKNEKN